jgi:hypothetical protein
VGLANVEQRFKQLRVEAGTVAEKVHAVLAEAATKINGLVDGEHPVLFSIIQHLEMAAHLNASSPALAEPATSAANPTQAGAPPVPAVTEEAPISTAANSTPNSTSSVETSSNDSKE